MNGTDEREYLESYGYIKTKRGRVERFRLNPPQTKYYEAVKREREAGRPVRIIILKARQMGFSTLTEGIIFCRSATTPNVSSMIVAHTDDSTTNLFNMSKLFYDELPTEKRPQLKGSNAKELLFENPTRDVDAKKLDPGLRSRIRCATAGGKSIGRSDTLTNLHASEYAFWPGDKRSTLSGLLQAVPALPDTMVIIESTANGFDDFKAMWDDAVAGESDFVPLFFAWWEMQDYRMPVPPGTVWTAEEQTLRERYSLEPEQLQWRRWCVKNNCRGDSKLFMQEYPACAEEAFLTSGRCVFDRERVVQRLRYLSAPLMTGAFAFDYDGIAITSPRFESGEGPIRIYAPPRAGAHYVIGCDTAGDGSDRFTAYCIDNRSGACAAALRLSCGEAEYARQLYCLGVYYNSALLAVETNFSTYPVMELDRLNYVNQYVREVYDDYTGRMKSSYGWCTTSRTRPVALSGLVTMFSEHPECFTDEWLLREMLTFVHSADYRPEAMQGEHDDMVMAAAIAYAARGQQETEDDAPEADKRRWSPDMLADYEAASPEARARMLNLWGHPK